MPSNISKYGGHANPYQHDRKKNSSVLVGKRKGDLGDISSEARDKLMEFLRFPHNHVVRNPTQTWIEETQAKIVKLDLRLQMPRDKISRAAIAIGKHNVRFFPEAARLCEAHKGLDPRVMRNLMYMVGNECTLRMEKFRRASRARGGELLQMPPEVDQWIDGMDGMALMWLDDAQAFSQLCGYKLVYESQIKHNECDACILSVVGSDPRMLANLWAGVKARKAGYSRHNREKKKPRLEPFLRAWVDHQTDADKDWIRYQSDALQPFIELARIIIVDHRRRVYAEERKQGRHRSKRHQHHKKPSHQHSKKEKSSASSRPLKSHENGVEYADRPPAGSQSLTRKHEEGFASTKKPLTSTNDRTMPLTPIRLTAWPKASEFERQLQEQEAHGDGIDSEYVVSPLTDIGSDEGHFPSQSTTPATGHASSRKVNVEDYLDDFVEDDEDDDDEYDENEDTVAVANAWFKRRTQTMNAEARVQLAQALPALSQAYPDFSHRDAVDDELEPAQESRACSTYRAMSAVPGPLRTPRAAVEQPSTDDGKSWYSASVYTYAAPPGRSIRGTRVNGPMPPPPPPPPHRRAASSFYSALPSESQFSAARNPSWEQFQNMFVNEDALARLEGRRGSPV